MLHQHIGQYDGLLVAHHSVGRRAEKLGDALVCEADFSDFCHSKEYKNATNHFYPSYLYIDAISFT